MPNTTKAAAAATEKNKLQLRDLSLIGVFGTSNDRRALVRHASGRIERVRPGERLNGRQVIAIDGNALLLRAGRGTRRLEMPAG
jgi:hypothetical protein